MADENACPVDELLARLTQQQQVHSQQKERLEEQSISGNSSDATDPYGHIEKTASVTGSEGRPDSAEVLRLQKELEFARERMAQMDLELTQSRIAKHTVEEAIGSPFPAAQQLAFSIGGSTGNGARAQFMPNQSANHAQQGPHLSSSFGLRHAASYELPGSQL